MMRVLSAKWRVEGHGVGGHVERVHLAVPDAGRSPDVLVVVAAAVVGHVAVVVVAEVALAARRDVAEVGGPPLRLVVAVDLAGKNGRLRARVPLLQSLRGKDLDRKPSPFLTHFLTWLDLL